MKIAFNPSTVAALTTPPNNKDITFDLRGRNIFARGVKFYGTDTNTWRDIKINNVSIGSHTLDLRNGSNTTLTNTNGVVTINSTWRPVVDNLTSDSTTSSLSAKQGKVLKALIDGKSNSDHNHDGRYVRAFGTSNDNIDSDWGQSFKTFDPIPLGTPPEKNPSISLLSIGENFNRRKQLAFIWNNDNIYYRRHTDSGFTNWRRLAFANEIPTSLKNPYALTISLNGTSQGPYDGSAAKNINITPGSIGAAVSNHSHDYLVVNSADDKSFNSAYHNFQVLYAGGGNGITGKPANVDAFGLFKFRAASGWSGQMLLANGGSLYIRSSEDAKMTNTLAWKTILDSSNYSGILDYRYYTELEVNSLLSRKLDRVNLTTGSWNPRGYHLAADYNYNGGDLSISENNGKMYISVDGCFWQNEGQYRVLDTSDIGDIRDSVTLHQYLSATDAAWYPLVWGGASHNNTSDSTGPIYKSYDKLCWQTSSQTLYTTHLQTTDITFPNSGTSMRGIQGTVGDNDAWRIKGGATASNSGYLEIATADDGNEPIYVRQYTGTFSTIKRTLTLLDTNGFAHFPSYINIGGNENNNSSPDRVWGSNSSDSYLRSYRTSALRVAYAVNANSAITASSANKLTTARNIALGMDLRGSANFDGSGNITINANINACTIGVGSTNGLPFKRIAHFETGGSWNDSALLLYISQGYINGSNGICRVEFRTDNISSSSTSITASAAVRWLVRNGYGLDSLYAGYYVTAGKAYIDIYLKTTDGYQGTVIRVLQDSRGGINSNVQLINSYYYSDTNHKEAYNSIEAASTALYNRAYTRIVSGSDIGTVSYSNSTGSVHWNNVTNKPSTFNPAAHTHTVFKNNLMIKGTNGISDSASIHLGIGDSGTGFKWISDGVCQIYANNAAVGQWTSGGMNWFKNPTVNGNKVWNAGNDGSGSGLDADTLDGYHAASFVKMYTGKFNQYNEGTWTKILQFTIPSGHLQPTISFIWHPTECARDVWADFNINIRSGSPIFYVNWKGTTRRTIYCVGDGTTYSVWVQGTKSWWDPFGLVQVISTWQINTYQAGSLQYSDSEPTGTYKVVASMSGIIMYADRLLTARKINGTSFDGTSDITTAYWGTTRTISLTGAITGSVSTNGGGNITINTTYGTGNITNLDNRYVKKAGDTMQGNLIFTPGKQTRWTAHGDSYITDGNADSGTSLGGNLANLVISSWCGVSFTTSCSGQTYTNKTAVGINCRTGIVYAANFVGPLQGNAATATKLQTSRSIWGQSFDGTGNVSGSLSEVGNIHFKVDNSYDIGSDAAASRYIYTHWLGAKSGQKLELGANNSGFGQGLCIDTNLNVGIGTNTPTQKLDVHGNIRATGQIIREGSGQLWVTGRNGALLRETSAVGYHTLWSLKTTDGSWDFGEYNAGSYWNNVPVLSYITDSNYNSRNNVTTYQIRFPLASGTVALTSNIPNPTNYYWANVKISASSSTTTSPTVLNLTATNSIRMGNILLEHTNEINNSANDSIHLNLRNSGNVSLCVGGGKVGIGTMYPSQELYVLGYTHTEGFGIGIQYLSESKLLPTISPGDGYTYRCLEIGRPTKVSCIIADKVPLSGVRGILLKFMQGFDGQIVLLKDLENYGSGNGYFWVMPSRCKIINADNSNILINQNQISNIYDDCRSRFFIYSSKYGAWIEFFCSNIY